MIFQGHVLNKLAEIEADSVHCVVTSPPYWSLRDYKLPSQVWDDPGGCDHEWEKVHKPPQGGLNKPDNPPNTGGDKHTQKTDIRGKGTYSDFCLKCNAWRGSLGLEPTPELYIQHLVEVFREVKRILRPDGCLFLNMGDLYSSKNYGNIREDEKESFFKLPLDIRTKLFRLWAICCGGSMQRDVCGLLSKGMEEEKSPEDERASQKVLQESQETISSKDSSSQQSQANKNDSGSGRQVRVLRGNRNDVSLPGSHKRGWEKRIQQKGRSSRGMEKGNQGGFTERQISDSLLELQRRTWSLWLVSSLKLNISDIPREARKLFKITLTPKDLCGLPWRLALALQKPILRCKGCG